MANFEVPSGTVDGVNAVFTASRPVIGEQLFVDGVIQTETTAYVASGNTITFTAGNIPPIGASLLLFFPGDSEIPAGTVDGVNAVFTTTVAVVNEQLFVDGLIQTPGLHYSAFGNVITFTSGNIPPPLARIAIFLPGASVISSGWATTTLANIKTSAKQRADMVNSQFLTDAEWNANINASYQELYGLLIQKFGNDYFMAGSADNWFQFTTSAAASYGLPDGTSTYTLKDGTTAPAFFKLVAVDLILDSVSNGCITLKPFAMAERNRFAIPNMQTFWGYANIRYRINGNTIWFVPLPSAGQTIRLWYIPRLKLLFQDSDPVDSVNGWEEYIIVDAAIKALQKEESDVSILMAQKQALIARLESEAENRDAGSPATVADTRRASDLFGSGFSAGNWGGY